MHVMPLSRSGFAHIIPAYLRGQLFYSLIAETLPDLFNNSLIDYLPGNVFLIIMKR